ncbi:MAG: ParB/RepB/Spo0J family partition protein [Nitrosopumilus sp.]|nr:ParB/RepB/Spo0J family partition protein [Nitrosopumilus sp.]MDH3341325.1 ParB/RepB/Spo0J family partition protein [Nitrosopumilus sp.]
MKIFSHKIETVPIKDVEVWDEAEARSLDQEGLRELAESIKREGLQNPPIVQKNKNGKYKLIAGQRRLNALKKIGARNIPVLVVQHPYDLEDAQAVSIIENLHRKQMSSKEMAEACDFLAQSTGSKKKAASALGISPSTFRSYLGFKGVPEPLKELVPKTISRVEAVQLSRIEPNSSQAVEVAKRISKYSRAARKRYLDALSEDPTAPHAAVKRMANYYKQKQNVRLHLSAPEAKALAKASTEKSMEPEELVHEIVGKWLARNTKK